MENYYGSYRSGALKGVLWAVARSESHLANTESRKQDILQGFIKAYCCCTVEDNIDPGQKLLLIFSTDGQLGLSEFSINRLNLLVEIRAIFSDPVKDLEAQRERSGTELGYRDHFD